VSPTRSSALAAAALAALAAGLGGCGGGGDKPATTATGASATAGTVATSPPAPTSTAPATSAPTTPAPPATGTTTSPGGDSGGERRRGRDGGTEPARTELELKVSGARISPRQAGVAPFIAVRVTLVAEDGAAHTLVIGPQRLTVGPGKPRASATLPGLKPGRSYRGALEGGQTVRILSTSEPGP
jgi:hypothetical protein